MAKQLKIEKTKHKNLFVTIFILVLLTLGVTFFQHQIKKSEITSAPTNLPINSSLNYTDKDLDKDLNHLAVSWLKDVTFAQQQEYIRDYYFKKPVKGKMVKSKRLLTEAEAKKTYETARSDGQYFNVGEHTSFAQIGWSNQLVGNKEERNSNISIIQRKLGEKSQVAVFTSFFAPKRWSDQNDPNNINYYCPCEIQYSVFLSQPVDSVDL